VPSLAGPTRPQDRIKLTEAKAGFRSSLEKMLAKAPSATSPSAKATASLDGQDVTLVHGSVVIAAITSCTNTSNPSVLLGAGLLAKKAVERGLSRKPWVKTSLAPGSKVVTEYLARAGLTPYLEQLGFHTVGYGCTTCIGNSGPLDEPIAAAITDHELVACAVLSGNRNFEGRIHPLVRANYLASPPLVVAYALAGTMDIDPLREPLGTGSDGKPVYLKEIWPSSAEIGETVAACVAQGMFRRTYADAFGGDERWKRLDVSAAERFAWDKDSTYVKHPPFFEAMTVQPQPLRDLQDARVLALLGDSVTTDHISPAGNIGKNTPAGAYLVERGVKPADFNSYGARRGNHEVMMRGTFANIRLRNRLAPGTEGGITRHLPDGEQMTIYEASQRYHKEGVPLLIIAGKEYGSGSSRDWAAKGPLLLGVRAVIAESFERIHRSNLIGMGVLPLQFEPGASAHTLALTGEERYEIRGIAGGVSPGARLEVVAQGAGGARDAFTVLARIDTPDEAEYFRHGGILPYVLRQLMRG
jgi:aconitate hydratase A / 2-methylisocitrate dehydratase